MGFSLESMIEQLLYILTEGDASDEERVDQAIDFIIEQKDYAKVCGKL
jgi:hypothetical protein